VSPPALAARLQYRVMRQGGMVMTLYQTVCFLFTVDQAKACSSLHYRHVLYLSCTLLQSSVERSSSLCWLYTYMCIYVDVSLEFPQHTARVVLVVSFHAAVLLHCLP
jgi:hypothetical protein